VEARAQPTRCRPGGAGGSALERRSGGGVRHGSAAQSPG
jgi:hypothetical protein